MRSLSSLLLAVTLLVPGVSAAADPTYEGRVLPGFVKDLLWQKACDLPSAEVEGEACKGVSCPFTRSNGTPFKPQMGPWLELTMLQWPANSNTLQPTLVEAKLATEDELSGDLRLAIGLLSGLPADLKPDDYLLQLNPALVRWVGREVLPAGDLAMCGSTAREFYLAAFAGPSRTMVDVYAQLKAKGLTKGLKESEVSKNFDTQKGRLASACRAIGQKAKNQDESWPRTSTCWWWLRRVASGAGDELAGLFRTVFERYDADALKSYAKVLPKPAKQTLDQLNGVEVR